MTRKLKRRKSDEVVRDATDSARIIRRRRKKYKSRVEFISSGSTINNLALSQRGIKGGWGRARVANIVGDGSSGKTMLALEAAFWSWKNIKKNKSKIFPKVKKIIIVFNNCEGVMDFPLEEMYGEEFVNSIEWICIKPIEACGRDFIRRLTDLKKGHFLLYIIDSWDALSSEAEEKRFQESIDSDKPIKGSYETEKQKYSSKFFSNVSGKLESNKKDATLFIISQVRTNIGITFGKKYRRSGGKALDFYTHQVAWIREAKRIEKTKKGHKRVFAIRSEMKVERNKLAKPYRESSFTILYDYGIDDLSSIIDFLWGKGTIRFDGKKFKKPGAFIKYVEKNNLEKELQKYAEEKWEEVEESFKKEVKGRKPRH